MKLALDFRRDEIHRLAHTYMQSFIHDQPERFESIKPQVDRVGDIDPVGTGLLAWIEGKSYLSAKIYAEWWQKKLGAKTYILWDTSEDYRGWAVWLPMSTGRLK